ncbi:hypothetical protein CEXT_202741 [Caerostris extrusa]|uniref:Uncharacterized protein n=1 Tax=Caerostris extrusa TaxID=172846 RepID=A0AAV4QN41_CAEEX|nr:hypothetical protein CEXT_202741 [Caerostris extrusa]
MIPLPENFLFSLLLFLLTKHHSFNDPPLLLRQVTEVRQRGCMRARGPPNLSWVSDMSFLVLLKWKTGDILADVPLSNSKSTQCSNGPASVAQNKLAPDKSVAVWKEHGGNLYWEAWLPRL